MGLPPGTAATTAPRPIASTERQWVRWTDLKKGKFLDHLAMSGNVAASAALIGVRVSAVYALRRRDAGFARDWQVAIESGYQLLETLVLGHVLSGAARAAGIETPHGATVDMDAALRLLAAYRGNGSTGPVLTGPVHRAVAATLATRMLRSSGS